MAFEPDPWTKRGSTTGFTPTTEVSGESEPVLPGDGTRKINGNKVSHSSDVPVPGTSTPGVRGRSGRVDGFWGRKGGVTEGRVRVRTGDLSSDGPRPVWRSDRRLTPTHPFPRFGPHPSLSPSDVRSSTLKRGTTV